nr:MAG TPA: hypothetical protein [Bacteriophage sp.]
MGVAALILGGTYMRGGAAVRVQPLKNFFA